MAKHVEDLEKQFQENEEKIKNKEINKQKNQEKIVHNLQNSTKAFRESIEGLKDVFCQSLVDLQSDMTSFSKEFDQKVAQKTFDDNNNNNNKHGVDELRLQVNKLNEEINNGPKNLSYSLSMLIEINKVEQDAKAQQQKIEVCIFMF